MDSSLRRRRDGVQVYPVLRVVTVVVDRRRRLHMRVPPASRCGRRGRRGGRALEEPLDLEELGGAEEVLQLVLWYGHFSSVDEPTTSHTFTIRSDAYFWPLPLSCSSLT